MIGRDGIAENSERSRVQDVVDLADFHRKIFEERRLMNVVALLVPLINFAGARRDVVPLRILVGKIAIEFTEHLRFERRLHRVPNFCERRPEVAQKSLLAVFVLADRFLAKIDIDAAGECERDHQRRRHQKVGFDVLVDASFEVAIP